MLQPLVVTSAGCATSGWRGWRGCWLHNRAAVVRVCARRVSVEDCTLAGAIRRVSQGSDPALRSSHSPASQPALCRPAAQHQRIHTTYTDTDPDTAPPSPAQTRPGPHTLPHHPLVPPDSSSSASSVAASEMCKFPCQQRMRGASLGQMDGSTTSTLHWLGEGEYNPQCVWQFL